MQPLQTIENEITELTNFIETNYPELYQHLLENPITLPSVKRPEINIEIMENYLESLEQLLKRHIETHKKK